MREIDPIRKPAEALLSAALHRLASSAPRSAPEELGTALAMEFRRYHQRRRARNVGAVALLAACFVLASVLWLGNAAGHNGPDLARQIAQQSPSQQTPTQSQIPTSSNRARSPQSVAKLPELKEAARRSPSAIVDENESGEDEFMALPSYDPAVNAGDLAVVRVRISGADLRLVGAPIPEDLSDQRLLADIAVGRDGTPYAVRLVQ